MHWFIWIVTLAALACWTLLAWASAWVLGLDPVWVADLATHVRDWPFAATMDSWLPGWDGVAAALLGLMHTLLASFGQAGVVLIWVAWGLGAVLLVGGAALASGLVALVRRATAAKPPPAPPGFQA